MLGLTELDDMVYQRLSRHDLTQCARVSKKWHSIVIPHLWRDLSWISLHNHKRNRRLFCNMVLEDYLAEQRRLDLLQKNGDTADPSQAQPSHPSSTLSKYGYWIRKLPIPVHLEVEFQVPNSYAPLLHLFKSCSPHLQVDFLSVELDELELDAHSPKKMFLDFSLPRLRHLSIRDNLRLPSSGIQDLMDMFELLDRHPVVLDVLTLNVDFSRAGMIRVKEDQADVRPKGWPRLQRLSFHRFAGSSDTNAFLSWLLKRCGSVKRLMVSESTGSAQCLQEGMLAYLPNLDEITLGERCFGAGCITDDVIAQLLSGSSNGWRTVRFGSKARPGEATMNALTRHFSTLQILDLDGCEAATGTQLVQVLGLCTHLHTLSTIYWSHTGTIHDSIDAEVFMDVEPDTGSLRPWGCENSLKVLKIKISGIPRPDLKEDGVIVETYPGQARELQGQVYDRLARLVNLETLWLGNQCSYRQSDCLEMSLESKLDKLSGLNKLKELDVRRMHTRIGAEEAQWMAEHWPRLRAINGLCEKANGEAARWLDEHCPDIELKDG
ncbi:MAG: hypothetical protein J3Q66DRAFT_350785 [Benniella sp.]|nr:MAG: hypothetical protein J3Q66DRAFT_350785 [Benniella sp.]